MKKVSLLFVSLAVAIVCGAKDIKTVVLNTTPEMHCSGCENRIKSNIRFEKGIKNIETNLENKTVTIEYDADKTSVEEIINGFKKINYEATVAVPKTSETTGEKKGGCCGNSCRCGNKNKK